MPFRCFAPILVACIAIASTCSAQSPPDTALPAPTGIYAVGTSIFHLVDSSRTDFVINEPGAYRELMVQAWYPADPADQAPRASYVPSPSLLHAMKEEGYMDLPADVIESWRSIQTHASAGVSIAQHASRFPLLVFSPGLGLPRFHYTSLLQEMASQGYIIIAIDHPYGGMTELPGRRTLSSSSDPVDLNDPAMIGQRTNEWAADASFVLDHLLNPGGSLGHFSEYVNQASDGHVRAFARWRGGPGGLHHRRSI